MRGACLGMERKATIKATTTPELSDLHWAAGFLDGEGSFSGGDGSQRVRATQKDEDALLHLQRIFGGSVVKRWSKQRQRDYWYWAVHGSRARGVMHTLYPLMYSYRRFQIRKALA